MPPNPARDARARRYVHKVSESQRLDFLLPIALKRQARLTWLIRRVCCGMRRALALSSSPPPSQLHKHTSLNPFIHTHLLPLSCLLLPRIARTPKLTWYLPFSQTSERSSQPSLIHLQTSNRRKPKPKPHNNKRNNSYKPSSNSSSSNNRIFRTSSLCNR